jgi:NAD(P)-dependent dehydrogenase (short-subunit alcohol dehydrogenase family)
VSLVPGLEPVLSLTTHISVTDEDWDLIFRVHVHGAYKTTRAAWPIMQAQKYGLIINTASGWARIFVAGFLR